jgi:transcriptional regulator with XRE-family HTH domain
LIVKHYLMSKKHLILIDDRGQVGISPKIMGELGTIIGGLKEACKGRQLAIAEESGTDPGQLSRILNGKENVPLWRACRIAEAAGTSLTAILSKGGDRVERDSQPAGIDMRELWDLYRKAVARIEYLGNRVEQLENERGKLLGELTALRHNRIATPSPKAENMGG